MQAKTIIMMKNRKTAEPMEGMILMMIVTSFYIPGKLDKVLRVRRTLIVLSTPREERCKKREPQLTMTMKKSRMFQGSLRYEYFSHTKPNAIILIIISRV